MIRARLTKARRPDRREISRRGRVTLLACLGVLAAAPFAVTAVQAALPTPPTFNFTLDEQGKDDQPGQKDLSATAVATPAPGELWTSWLWDVTSLSGGNTGDACSLFDTDIDGKVNFAVCVTIEKNPAQQAAASPRVYTCGDGKVDRCTSTYTEVDKKATQCETNTNANDPFHPGQKDTQAICKIDLSAVGGFGTASLVNTCSYPSQQPTSDPSDCVLIPRDAFLKIVKDATPDAGTFPFHLGVTTDANPPVVFTAQGDDESAFMPIRSDVKYNLKEDVPSNWELTSASCTGASGTGSSNGSLSGSTIGNIDASPDNQIVCTYNNRQQTGGIRIVKTRTGGTALAGAAFAVYTDNAPTGGTEPGTEDVGTQQSPIAPVATCTTDVGGHCTMSSLPLGSYWVVETSAPAGYSKAAPKPVTLSSGNVTVDVPFEDTLDRGTITVHKTDDGGNLIDSVKFTLVGTSTTGDTVNMSCITGLDGECSFLNVPLGTYTLDEDASTIIAGFTKDPSLPKQVTVSTNGQTVTVNVTNPRSLRVITLVCFEGNVALRATDVTSDGTTKTSISAVPQVLADKGVTKSELCSIGGARFDGLPRTDKSFDVDLG